MIADHQREARAILSKALAGEAELKGREGQFLGGIAFDANSLSEKQSRWLAILAERHGWDAEVAND